MIMSIRGARREGGFTLIEMLCTVCIAGAISAVAYPAVKGSIHKSRRGDALVAMMQAQIAQERFRSNHTTYGELKEIGIGATSPSNHYTLEVVNVAENSYTIVATAIGAQAHDARCRVLKLTAEGMNVTQSSGDDAGAANPPDLNRQCWNL